MKTKFDYDQARAVADKLCDILRPFCDRITVAGSLRRGKPEVSDVEIVYVPKCEIRRDPMDLFAEIEVNLADINIEFLIAIGTLEKRKNVLGRETFGAKNKLMVHCETDIPVDLFATEEACWFNYLVCRTGPRELNELIATRAIERGWKWHPYGCGFIRGNELKVMTSERAVFEFVGLEYLEPEERQ